ncbi:MAG: serine hydrolase [Ignavibacteriales bacterium]|nr:serine hydrolase [Ignavibacteriales bacterium]
MISFFHGSDMMKRYAAIFISILVLQLGCAGTRGERAGSGGSEFFPATSGVVRTAWIDSTLNHLTLEEQVAQMFVIWTPGRYFANSSEQWQELERIVVKRKIGGIYFSLGDVYEFAMQANRLQKLAAVPLLISSDFEWGAGMRIKHSTTFPRAMAIGATRNLTYAYGAGRVTALEGRALGIHHNYAPDVDVNLNPKNPVINTRAYGDDVRLVSEMGAAFVRGTQEGGMIATVKHFPGHGDTDVDTHVGLSVLNLSRARMDSVELAPFRAGVAAGSLTVMIGHMATPIFDTSNGIPATTSYAVTSNLLRNELKFGGLVITDAMSMQAVAAKYQPGEAAVLAVKAGTDIVLLPANVDAAVDAVVAAVKCGEISESRIEASVRRILSLKQRMNLDVSRFVNLDRVADVVGSREHQLLALKIARDAVTVLGNTTNVLPFSTTDQRKMLDLLITDEEVGDDGKSFHAMVDRRWQGKLDFYQIDPHSNAMDYDSAFGSAKSADLILVQLHLFMRSGAMTGFVDPKHAELLKKIASLNKPAVVLSFGNPYAVMEIPTPSAYVCLYSDADVMQQACAEVLFAEEPARGKLPITIPGLFKFGEGIAWPKTRLREGKPEEAGFDSKALAAVNDVVHAAVKDSAFPGAVLLVARNGVIVHHKAYGAYDYEKYSKLVDVNTMYDLASVTKVIATTSAVMRLADEKKLALDDPVVKYVPQFGQNGKERITLYNLMVHNSGLPAWRKFYEFCGDPVCVLDSVYATPLTWKTGDTTVYSDLGLITMGKVIEKVSSATLDWYVDSVFFKPLGMNNTMYNPPSALINRIAPTEVDSYWKKTGVAVRGRVHDENAATLGGVSGHAGLFSTASDLAKLLQMELNGGTYGGIRFIREETIKRFTTRQSEKSSRGIGWDTKSSERSFSGTLTSAKTFLHTGFTGTSVVVDPEKNLIIVFLTNRVHPTRASGKIADVRPKVHDAILRAIVR